MKNKLSKIFLAIFSIFLLAGGGIFSACDKELPQATIEVSSSDFVGDDYIEIDLGSDVRTATLTAKVSGISGGLVSADNDYQSIITTSAVYDSKNETTSITIVGKSEGDALLVLRSHGNGKRVIRVYVYSDITSLDQTDNERDRYVVRGQANTLNPDKLLKFGSREGGDSNRKDVTWSLKTSDRNISLDGNVLTVGEDYQKYNSEATIEVYADSVYVDKRTTVTLRVISALPDYATYISRTSDAQGTELTESGTSFNLVKNDDSNEESKLFARLVVPVSSQLTVTPRVYSASGVEVTDKLDPTHFNSRILSGTNEIIYKITAKDGIVAPEELTICFDVGYADYSYSKQSTRFVVNLVDVIDRIDVKSNGSSITKNDAINIYDYYNNDSSYQYGHPFLVKLGPETVANNFAKYFVELTVPTGKAINGLVLLSDQYGSPISFVEKVSSTALGDTYRSENIDNNTVVYFLAGSTFDNGDALGCKFVSQQTERVNLPINLKLYNSPKENFNIDGGGLEYYLSTNKYDSKHIEVTASALMGIDGAGIKLDYAENDKISVTNFRFDPESGKISFDVANKVLNIERDDAKLSVRIEHSNGFVSKQEIVVSSFIPLQSAYVNYKGQSTTAVSRTEYGVQDFYRAATEYDLKDNTLTKLIMKSGNTVEMNFVSNCNANVGFKLIEVLNLDGLTNQEIIEELLGATEIIDAGITNPVNNAGRLTIPSQDVKYYALVSFSGYDENHEAITIYRYFYLEGYTAPTRLIPDSDDENIELFALDSVSVDERNLSTQRITIKYRSDNKPVTYWEGQKDNGGNPVDIASTSISVGRNGYWTYENFVCTDSIIAFDIVANTTAGRESVTAQAVVLYEIFNTIYTAQINITIKNAQRVEKVVHTNENPDDGIIYLDLNGTSASDKSAVILTSVEPSNAYNKELEYVFVADDGTLADLIEVSDLGIVTFKEGATSGGSGYIYILPKDAIRDIGGVKGISYYKEGSSTSYNIKLSELGAYYDEICTGDYYFKGAVDTSTNTREQIYYKNIILKIRVVVADGESEETATRIYNETGLRTIQSNKHYELMSSISLSSDWTSLTFDGGSLRGHNENITINLTGSAPLLGTIGENAKVKDLILTGSVEGKGMLTETNNGIVENIKVSVYSDKDGTVKPTVINGSGYVGGLVGVNNGSILNSAVEGATIVAGNDDSNYVGGIAGLNTGTISGARVEFYKISESSANTFTGFYVGGIVGYLSAGGVIKGSYAYNYSSVYPLSGAKLGAFAGKALSGNTESEGATIFNSFAILAEQTTQSEIVSVGENGEEETDVYGHTYFVNTAMVSSAYWGYGSEKEAYSDGSFYWVKEGNENFKSYVRSGEKHLGFYQEQAITSDEMNALEVKDVVDSANDITKALKIDAESGILFITSLKDSSSLTDGERAYLRAYNTISITDLLGLSDTSQVVVSSSSRDVEINGSNIVLLGKTNELKIKISSKHDFGLSREFTFKIVYALDQLTVWHDGVETLGFTLQEGRTGSMLFTIKDAIYLGNSGESFKIKLEDYEMKTSIDPVEAGESENVIAGKISFNADITSATLLAASGTKDELAKAGKESFNANVWIEIKGFENNSLIEGMTKKTLQIYPTKGSQLINVTNEELSIIPAYQSELDVVLVTDDKEDELLLTLKYGDVAMTKSGSVFSLGSEQRIKIDATRGDYDSNNKQYKYKLVVSVCEQYRHKISEQEEYVLVLTSKTGTASNEAREIAINLFKQSINNVDITNYASKTTSIKNGAVVYTRDSSTVSVISPGRNSMMQVSIDPTFAHYEYMTLTYQNADGAVLGITALKSNNDSGYVIDGTAANVERGVKLLRNENGVFNFRLYAAANIMTDTVFHVIASFYDKDGQTVIDPVVFDLYISYLPEAEITINGDISALVAKGGNLDITMLLKSDQEIDSISATNVKGISISPKSTWIVEDNGNGTKTVHAKLYAGLNAGILQGDTVVNGEFAVTAVVSRIFNGAREEKRSNAYVTVVDFLPESAEVKNSTEKNGSSVKVLDSYIGIPIVVDFEYGFNPAEYAYDHSNSTEVGLYETLNRARAEFQASKSYYDETTGFVINADSQGNTVPIYKRLKIGNQKINFVKSEADSKVWIFNYTKFRLSYNEETGVMTVMGLSSTASPVVLTLVDEISVASSGKAIKYTIETQFAIDVVTYSDPDMPLLIKDETDFLKVAEEGTAQSYILLNDITLKNYTPISASMFKMLDGNGYTINIESFNTQGTGALNLALFTSVPATTTIKNLKINYYNGGKINVDTTSSGYSTINVAGVAISNAGIITNTQVIAYQNADTEIVQTGSTGLQVNLLRGSTQYYIDDNSNIKAQIAGFVINNTGSITNSRVGGDSIIVVGDQIEANYTYYTNQALDQFVLSGQGDMAGFVISNTGNIVSSGASNIQITNLSTSTKTLTAGFVVTNAATVGTSYVEGSKDESQTTQYHLTGSNISSRGVVAGFVVNNGAKGIIKNAYSNIFISNSNDTQSRTSAGFVYYNEGKIAYSYSASKVEKANILQSNFSGVDGNGNSQNKGKIELSYYYISDYADDPSEDVQELLENQASRINKDAVDSENSYYGFIFSSSSSTQDGIWEVNADSRAGVKLICRNEVTISHRYYQAISEDEYALPYSILKDRANTAGTEYNTELGNDCNPILISNATEFKEAMGESKSIYVKKFYNNSKVWGTYRFVSNITLSDLNNELGNAEVSSIDKVFSGKLDGNGFAIKNISIKSSNDSVGLFGEINNAVVANLDLEVDNITASKSYTVGALTGLAKNSVISNISLTQKSLSEGTSGKGVLGRNITGGIIGSVFGDCYITGLSAQDVIVQSSYYNNETDREKTYLGLREQNNFNAKALREYESQSRSKFFSDDNGIGAYSFAGSIIGYSDTYLTNEYSSLGFIYNQNLSDSQYAIKKLAVSGSIDVRGEIVGGVIGYTGINTKAKDINVVLSKGDGYANNILSYNGLAGTIVGYANGQFHQVYAEHDESTQEMIESSTYSYYANGTTSVERGELELFKFKESSTGAYKYEPVYVGGLMGAVDSGAISVSYSKINAINYTNGGYAGGIAGYVKGSTQYNVAVEAYGITVKTTLYLNEVYASGDVYADGGFAGLFGKFDDSTKLTIMSVNAVNYYGMAIENDKATGIYAISTNASAENVNVYPAAVATDGLAQADIKNVKSFGYMREYSAKGKNIEIKPYKDYNTSSDADFFFQISALSSFTSPEDGYTETNGAFINSNSWDSDNWTHRITDLYPRINLVNQLNYIYLDCYNKVSVIAKMQNSSIEVRVRGKVSANEDRYENVDLRDVIGDGIVGFSGKLVGGVDGSWGTNFGAVQIGIFGGLNVTGYPGIVIDKPLFRSTGSGVAINNLNIVVKATTDGGKVEANYGLISQQELIRGKFENISLYIDSGVVIKTDSSAAYNAGLLVPSAQSSSFKNIAFNFTSDAAVEFSLNDGVSLNGESLNVGLLTGEILQNSKYESVKIQDITIKQANASVKIMGVTCDSAGDANIGLYVGHIYSNANAAGVVLTAKAPETWNPNGIDENFNSQIVVGGCYKNTLNFGGYYGFVESQNTTLTFTKSVSGAQTLTLINQAVKETAGSNTAQQTEQQIEPQAVQQDQKELNEGGLIGNAILQGLTFMSTNADASDAIIHTNLQFAKSQSKAKIGLLFGSIQGAFNIENTLGGVVGKIYTVSNNNETTTISDSSIGGLIGENNATITINDMTVSLKVYEGTTEPAGNNLLTAKVVGASETQPMKISGAETCFGGFIGKNSGAVATADKQDKINFNKEGENIALIAGNDKIYYGDFIGFNNNAATVKSFTSNAVVYINAPTVNAGGVIGYSTTDNTASATVVEGNVHVLTNFFIDNPTNLNAGGMIGEIKSPSSSCKIENTAFGGAFKFVNVTGGTHHVGGIVGSIDENISVTIKDNTIYGDAIYTYTGGGQLVYYYFGGVVGRTPQNATITGNIIAFTNNNSRKALYTTSVNAVVGNNDGIGAGNSYCSQLVLATNDFATDYGYNKSVAGYGSTETEQSITEMLITKLGDKIAYNNLPLGHKLKPITTGSKAGNDGHLNGISYYTEKYPTGLENNTLSNAAFIGDFTNLTKSATTTVVEEGAQSPIVTVGQHAFVSGVVVSNNVTDVYANAFTGEIGGIARKLCDGIIFACKSMGTLSIGGNGKVNVGGIVGLMQTGRIAECYSSVDIVYRAASGGTAAGIAVTSEKMSDGTTAEINYIENSYSTGEVGSYISADLYAFTNGASAWVKNSYTISHISAKDHTISGESTGTLGIFGSATCTDCSYDKDATEYTGTENVVGTTAVPNVSYKDGATLTGLPSGWVADMANNCGYMRRNFKAFEASSSETIDGNTYYLIPNITKFLQMKNGSAKYKLIRDIDIAKTSKADNYSTLDLGALGVFDGNGHTISNNKVTLFYSVGTLKNLRVEGYTSGADGITGSAVVAKLVHEAENVIATGLLDGKNPFDGGIGGLFAKVTSVATNCKNYVKIDVSEVEAYIGGIAGKGTNATSCFNYGPINVEKSKTRVAGIYGYATGKVSYCGNENSVFNGYTNTTASGDYYAAGIVGLLHNTGVDPNTVASISHCYNTGMIKVGNKNLNPTGSGAAYAAGIVASNLGSVDAETCYNSGFIEALGSMSKLSELTTVDLIYRDSQDITFGIGLKFWCNYDGKDMVMQNVSAYSICENYAHKNNSAYVYNNGFHEWISQEIFWTKKTDLIVGESRYTETGIEFFYDNAPSDNKTRITPRIASVDEMGVPNSFFIESIRTIKYAGNANITRDQTRFTRIQNLSKTYYDMSIGDGSSNDFTENINDIRKNAGTASASESVDVVTIAGTEYAFAGNGSEFARVMNSNVFSVDSSEAKYYTGLIGGKTIQELKDAGYKFSLTNVVPPNSNIQVTDTAATYDPSDGGKLKISIKYMAKTGAMISNNTPISFTYSILASKDSETEEFSIGSMNLVIEKRETAEGGALQDALVLRLSETQKSWLETKENEGREDSSKIYFEFEEEGSTNKPKNPNNGDEVTESRYAFIYDIANPDEMVFAEKQQRKLTYRITTTTDGAGNTTSSGEWVIGEWAEVSSTLEAAQNDLLGKKLKFDAAAGKYLVENLTYTPSLNIRLEKTYTQNTTTYAQQTKTYGLGMSTFTYSNEYLSASDTGLVKSTSYSTLKRNGLSNPNDFGEATRTEYDYQLKMSHQVNGYVSNVTFNSDSSNFNTGELSCQFGGTNSKTWTIQRGSSNYACKISIGNFTYKDGVTSFDIVAEWENEYYGFYSDNITAFENAEITIDVLPGEYNSWATVSGTNLGLALTNPSEFTVRNGDVNVKMQYETLVSGTNSSTRYCWTIRAAENKNLMFKVDGTTSFIMANSSDRSFSLEHIVDHGQFVPYATTIPKQVPRVSVYNLDEDFENVANAAIITTSSDGKPIVTITDSGAENGIYVYGTESASLPANATDRTVTFNYSADATTIKKYYYQGDGNTAISISDGKIYITESGGGKGIYEYNGTQKSIQSAENPTVTFDYSASATTIKKYYYQGDDNTAITLSDSTISITDSGTQNVIYQYGNVYKCVYANDTNRTVTFDYSASATSIKKYAFDNFDAQYKTVRSKEITAIYEGKQPSNIKAYKSTAYLTGEYEVVTITNIQDGKGKINLDGTEYNVEIKIDETTTEKTLLSIDGNIQKDGLYKIGDRYYSCVYDSVNDQIALREFYNSRNGIIDVDGVLVVCQLNAETGIDLFYPDMTKLTVDEDGYYTIAGKKYGLEYTSEEVSGYSANITPNKIPQNVEYIISGNDITKDTYISFDAYGCVDSDFRTLAINKNEVHKATSGSYISSNGVAIYIDEATSPIGPENGDIVNGIFTHTYDPKKANETNKTYRIVYTYDQYTTRSTVATAHKNATGYTGVILTADIDLYSNGTFCKDTNISGEGKIVNFVNTYGGLFDDSNGSSYNYMKNVGFAGTTFSLTRSGSGMLGRAIAVQLVNVATYGTVGKYGKDMDSFSVNGIAGELSNTMNNKVNNFASISTFNKKGYGSPDEGKLYGIGRTISGTNFANYGVIIGRRGKDGGIADQGVDGQTVYAISSNSYTTSMGDIFSALNYGIIKAGDGGNGGRGFEGSGGKDADGTFYTEPKVGIRGTQGCKGGKAGSAYIYATEPDENNVLGSEPGLKGADGNDGWGGLSLGKFSERFSGTDDDDTNFAQLTIYSHASIETPASTVTVGLKINKSDSWFGDREDYTKEGDNLYYINVSSNTTRYSDRTDKIAGNILYTYIKWNVSRIFGGNVNYVGTGDRRTCVEGYYVGDPTSANISYVTLKQGGGIEYHKKQPNEVTA